MKIENKKVFVVSSSEPETGYIKAITDICQIIKNNPRITLKRLIELMSDNLDNQLVKISDNFHKRNKN